MVKSVKTAEQSMPKSGLTTTSFGLDIRHNKVLSQFVLVNSLAWNIVMVLGVKSHTIDWFTKREINNHYTTEAYLSLKVKEKC